MPTVAAALAALLLLVSTEASAAEPGRPLRVVSYNLFHGGASSGLWGDDEHLDERLDMVVRALRALDADVIGLQEASVSWGRGNVAARLAQALGFHYAHAPATPHAIPAIGGLIARLMNFSEGPAIVSRFPIVATEIHQLPRCRRWYDSRVLLRAALDTPWGRLDAYSTHVSRDDCQVERVGQLVRSRRGPLPAIVTGDFNATDALPAVAALTNGIGFVDAFRAANPAAPGLTVWQRIAVPTPTVFRRVDYVFVAPGASVGGRVVASRVVLDEPGTLSDGSLLWPSDHYGVYAEIDLGPAAATAAGRPR